MSAFVLGVTGGIGSGKTAVTDCLSRWGITVVDADVVARTVVEPGQPALNAIMRRFGAEVLLPTGALNRAALRALVFSDPTARRDLEAITHPAIRTGLEAGLKAATSPYAVLASPLLFESGQVAMVDRVWVVDVPEATQRARAAQRDSVSPEQIEAIMAAQWPRADRLARADLVIDNQGSLETLQQHVQAAHEQLLRTLAGTPS